VNRTLEDLPNHELLERTQALVRRGRALEAELLHHLGEVDARRLYLEQACSSMFVYCVRALHFSEAAAYKRIRASGERAHRRSPSGSVALPNLAARRRAISRVLHRMARYRKREGKASETPVAEESPVRRPPFSAQRDLGSARRERLV
jgi:hypothetical protein